VGRSEKVRPLWLPIPRGMQLPPPPTRKQPRFGSQTLYWVAEGEHAASSPRCTRNPSRRADVPRQLIQHPRGGIPRLPEVREMAFRAATYNVLATAYIKPEWYAGVPPELLKPSWRVPALVRQVESLDADLLCLQEVEA